VKIAFPEPEILAFQPIQEKKIMFRKLDEPSSNHPIAFLA
jgi:hypothetical protein